MPGKAPGNGAQGTLGGLVSSEPRRVSGQGKTENVAAGGDGQVLLPVDAVAHRRSRNGLAGVEVPEWLAGSGVHGLKRLRVVCKKDQTAGGGHGAARGMAFAGLHVAPRRLLALEREGQENFLVVVALAAAGAG